MDKKFIIREYYALCDGGVCEDLLNENEKRMRQNGAMVLSGKLSEADRKNGNGRYYGKRILEREIKNFNYLIEDNRALGCLDHPPVEVIEVGSASHMFLRTWWEGNEIYGTCKVLSTPQGKVLEALINDEVKLGISSRGVGSVQETQQGIIVSEDFQLVTFDFVNEPSSQEAFMSLTEAKGLISLPKLSKRDRINKLMEDVLRNK